MNEKTKDNEVSVARNFSRLDLFFLVLVLLKVTGHLNVSWWVVFSPYIALAGLTSITLLIMLIMGRIEL